MKIFDLFRIWKKERKDYLFGNPEKVYNSQLSAIRAISWMEWYKMIKDFHYMEMEKAIEKIKNSSPGENIEKYKAILEYSEKLILFLESRES